MMARTGPMLGPLAMGVLVLAGCSSGSNPPATSTTTTTTSAAKATTTSTTTATTTSAGVAQNLIATATIRSDLVAAFVAHNGLPANEVAGTAPGSVYYGFLPSTSTYWAIASFVPTATASSHTQVALQDEGAFGIFTQASGGSWTYVAGYIGAPCPGQVPAELATLWHLVAPGSCTSVTTTTAAG